MALEVIPLTKHIGAEIRGVNLAERIDEQTRKNIHEAWLRHLVLLFREQTLTQQDLLNATTVFGRLGKVGRPKEFRPSGYDSLLEGIMLISNIRENGEAIGALPDGEMMFHHDMLHAEMPHKGTCLYSVEVPSVGGNTLCPSSDNLRHFGQFSKGGSGSSGLEFKRLAADAASVWS